jgi:hypothetical protein
VSTLLSCRRVHHGRRASGRSEGPDTGSRTSQRVGLSCAQRPTGTCASRGIGFTIPTKEPPHEGFDRDRQRPSEATPSRQHRQIPTASCRCVGPHHSRAIDLGRNRCTCDCGDSSERRFCIGSHSDLGLPRGCRPAWSKGTPVMKVLVTAASRHGTTAEIAEIIAGVLRSGPAPAVRSPRSGRSAPWRPCP